ncbi:hypothetical protein AVEN_181555-1 [Araneus ventricosus]|uniref:Uncharacterized protein n=1 Tax=Araneus ventricosus TaxID=182803 RepID=A0A4Y2E547_ARAVE|nr:hypothetical protein AVEN_181555-1 [Araneus ventricosus]
MSSKILLHIIAHFLSCKNCNQFPNDLPKKILETWEGRCYVHQGEETSIMSNQPFNEEIVLRPNDAALQADGSGGVDVVSRHHPDSDARPLALFDGLWHLRTK